ncbi:MAG: tandem-95 repeat protein, partial [Desulfomonile tiedjei]|nr:tandem-95 repeat protein [Desulfomonile tiedjei]
QITGAPGHAQATGAAAAPSVPTSYDHVFNEDLNVVLISNQLADVQTISDAAAANAKVIVYDAQHDNLSTISAQLQDLVNSTGHKIDNLAIVGHGSAGVLSLGTDQIMYSSLTQFEGTFQALSASLSEDAQIQFYGCSLAADASGKALVDSIATFSSADVFASTDTTGGNAHDWTLEYASNSTVAMHTLLNADALAADNTPLAGASVLKYLSTDSTSSPTNYVTIGTKVYFAADDQAHGKEIWVYDTVARTTSLLYDLNATNYSSINATSIQSNPLYLTVVTNPGDGHQVLFFSATDTGIVAQAGQHGQELWMYDPASGQPPQLVEDIYSATPSSSSSPASLVDVNGALYFTANDGTGVALWKSTDGTAANTVKETNTLGLTAPANLTNVNGTLFFTGTTTATGTELFKVNAGGSIELVKNFNGTATASSPASLTNVNGTLYLTANDGTGVALWMSTDGTPANTTKVTNTLGLTAPANLTNVNGTLMFTGTTTATGTELFKVNAGGSIELAKDFNGTATASSPASLTNVNGTLYLTANDGTGIALWKSTDGTPANTTKVANTAGVTAFASLANINGTLFFAGTSAATGSELYKVDATNGVTLVQDIYSGTSASGPSALTDIGGGKLVFTANGWSGAFDAGATGNEPWVYDPAGGATLLKDIMISHQGLNGGDPAAPVNVNGTIYWIQTIDSVHGAKLMRYDGTTTSVVPGVTPDSGRPLTNVNGTLFFNGNDGVHGSGLMIIDANGNPQFVAAGNSVKLATAAENILYYTTWSDSLLHQSNGTAAGTITVSGPAGFSIGGMTPQMTNVNGTMYFNAYTSTSGWELFQTNGNGTATMVADINPGLGAGSNILNMTNVNGTLFFSALTSANGQELYKFDPTTDTAPVLIDISTGTGSSSPSNFINVNNTLYFTATDGTSGIELYTTDGLTATRVADINPGAGNSNPTQLTNVNGTTYFVATDATGSGLWQTDGTTTTKVTNTPALTGFSTLFNANGTLLFMGYNATTGQELYKVDPTNGVTLVQDIYTGATGSNPSGFTLLDGITYFKATDATSGTELWQYNGTSAGLVQDLYQGPYAHGNPTYLTAGNNAVFFRAAAVGGGSIYGDQIWKVDGAGTNDLPTATNLSQAVTMEEDSGSVGLTPIVVGDADGDTITATLSLGTPSSGALSVSGGATYNPITGFWSITGDATTVSTALAAVTFTPVADWNGTVNIITHVQDAKGTSPMNGLATITVTPVNDAASANAASVALNEDPGAPVAVVLSGNPGPANEQGQILSYTLDLTGMSGKLFSDAGGLNQLAQGATVTAGAQGQTPVTVYYLPDADYAGPTSFSYTASDDGGTPVQGTSTPAAVTVGVAAVNDAPAHVNIPAGVLTTTEDAAVVFSTATGNAISISDVDLTYGTASQPYTVTFTTAKTGVGDISSVPLYLGQIANTGNVYVAPTAGVTITGNNSATVTLSGTLADINTALSTGLEFRPYAEGYAYSGASNALLTMVTSDNGNIFDPPNAATPLTATSAINVTVTPVADAPVNTLGTFSVPAGTTQLTLSPNGISVHDGDVNDTLFVEVEAGTGVAGIGWGARAKFSPAYVYVGTESMLNSLLNGITASFQPGFFGQATVLVTTTDISGATTTGTVTIDVAPGQLPPQVTTGATGYQIWEDDAPPLNLGNCVTVSDPNGDPLIVDLVAPVGSGWSSLNATGSGAAVVTGGGTTSLHITGTMVDVQNTLLSLSGTLSPNFNGTSAINVTATDGHSPVVNAVVNLPVQLVNDAPVANAGIVATGNEDAAIAVTLSMTDPQDAAFAGGPNSLLSANIVTGPAHGTLTQVGPNPGDWSYTPNADWYGTDSFTYTVTDNGGTVWGGQNTSAVAETVTINVNSVNDAPAPVAGSTSVTLGASVPVTLALTDLNDAAGPGGANALLGATIVTAPAHGTLSFVGPNPGDWVYTSDGIFTGVDTFTYNVQDNGGVTNGGVNTSVTPATFSINVTAAPNVAPTATNMTQPHTILEDSGALNLTDIVVTDPDVGDTITATLTLNQPAAGSLSANNGATYNPVTGVWSINGTASAVNLALANATFSPTANWNGTATIATHVADAALSGPADGLITVNVTAVNDAPVANAGIVAAGNEDAAIGVTLGMTDPTDAAGASGPNSLSGVTIVTGPAHGILTQVGPGPGDFSYTPNANWYGTDSFTYTVTDNGGVLNGGVDTSSPATLVTIDVASVNDAPAALPGSTSVTVGGSVPVTLALTDTNDAAGPPPGGNSLLAATIVTGPAHGTVTYVGPNPGDWVYTSDGIFTGIDSFTYNVQDNGGVLNGGADTSVAPATFTINVNPPGNTVPIATNMTQNHTILEDSGQLNLTDIVVTDPDAGDTVTATLTLNQPAAGSLSANNGATYNPVTGVWSINGTVSAVNLALANATFTPAANWNGTATVTTHVVDAALSGPADGLITVGVTTVNDAPVANAGIVVSGNENTAIPVTLGMTDPTDAAGPSGPNSLLQANIVTGPAHGTVTQVGPGPGDWSYTPDLNWAGTDTFTYTVTDNGGTTNGGVATSAPPTLVTINVAAGNDAPVNTVPLTVQDVSQGQSLIFTGSNAISVTDADAGTAAIQMDLTATHGTMTLGGRPPASLTITGNGTASIRLVGSQADINTALNGMTFFADGWYFGPATITVATNDLGHTPPPATTDTDVVNINVIRLR